MDLIALLYHLKVKKCVFHLITFLQSSGEVIVASPVRVTVASFSVGAIQVEEI